MSVGYLVTGSVEQKLVCSPPFKLFLTGLLVKSIGDLYLMYCVWNNMIAFSGLGMTEF